MATFIICIVTTILLLLLELALNLLLLGFRLGSRVQNVRVNLEVRLSKEVGSSENSRKLLSFKHKVEKSMLSTGEFIIRLLRNTIRWLRRLVTAGSVLIFIVAIVIIVVGLLIVAAYLLLFQDNEVTKEVVTSAMIMF